MGDFIQQKIMPPVLKFVNTPAIQALKDGMVGTIPLIITGSIFLILGQLPIESWATAVRNAGLEALFLKAYGATFQINAIVAVTGIAYAYIKNAGYEPYSGCMVALGSFLTIQPNSVAATISAIDGSDVPEDILATYTASAGSVINKTWTGGQGMVAAIIVGLLVGWGYSSILKKDIRIKMPEGVPEGVANAFTALIPAIVIITITMIFEGIATLGFGDDLISLIYTWIGIPLQGLSDSFGGIMISVFLVHFLWFFGVHGATVVGGIMTGVWTANYLDNEEIFQKLIAEYGSAAAAKPHFTLAEHPELHVVTQQFYDNMITITGSGCTIGIVLYCMFLAKSEQYKALGRIAIGPAIFNINEPIIFGIPIVMNPVMVIPFIVSPLFNVAIEYLAISTGICPPYKGVLVPWTTPPVISGFFIGDWRTSILQFVCLAFSCVIYFPFIRYADKQALEAQAAAGNDEDDDW
jgi:PTS system cellobiose-specific IIC component